MAQMNTIVWKPKAVKQLAKIKEMAMRQRIYTEIQVLTEFPQCHGVRRLANHAFGYRLRVGDFRVFFDFDGEIRIVSIEEVKKTR